MVTVSFVPLPVPADGDGAAPGSIQEVPVVQRVDSYRGGGEDAQPAREIDSLFFEKKTLEQNYLMPFY